jgi:hypothetical protein
MADFNVRSDSVNVEHIMEQIRARIRDKRGVDYTEQQIRELAAVKLEKFLDPRGVRSDLLDQFRKAQPAYEPPELPNFAFEDATLFESHRGPIRGLRKLLLPILKLFFNPNPLIQALNIQSRLNTINAENEARRESARRQMDQLYYELIHNLVIETTRLGIEVKNLKMRVESVSSRLEFNERRARALESVVVYKASEAEAAVQQAQPQSQQRFMAPQPHAQPFQQTPPRQHVQQIPTRPQLPQSAPPTAAAVAPAPSHGQPADAGEQGAPGEGPGQRSRRRRRRRGRRGGGLAAAMMGAPGVVQPATPPDASASDEAGDQMEAMDRMDDDGAPEAEESHAAAAEKVAASPAPEASTVQSTDSAQRLSTGSESSSILREPEGGPAPDRETTRSGPGGSDTDTQ